MDFELWLSFANDLFLLFLGVGVEIEVYANSAPTELELELGLSLATGLYFTVALYSDQINFSISNEQISKFKAVYYSRTNTNFSVETF